MAKTSWLIVTFGEGCLYVLVFRALKRFSRFSKISPTSPFKSISLVKYHHQK
jgi:hypothetical protein